MRSPVQIMLLVRYSNVIFGTYLGDPCNCRYSILRTLPPSSTEVGTLKKRGTVLKKRGGDAEKLTKRGGRRGSPVCNQTTGPVVRRNLKVVIPDSELPIR